MTLERIVATPEVAGQLAYWLRCPVVFRGLASYVLACQKWTPAYIDEACGDEIVKVRRTISTETNEVEYVEMRLGAYLERLALRRAASLYYLSDWIPPKRLCADLEGTRRIPNIAHRIPQPWRETVPYYFIQIGSVGAHYAAHRDFLGSNAWAFQISGRKVWRLWKRGEVITDVISPGEVLYVPGRWWHEVTSTETTLSFVMNQWTCASTISVVSSLFESEDRALLLRLLRRDARRYYI